jgi:hypothetical protein
METTMETGKPQPQTDSMKCVRDLRAVPPQVYAMAKDGRKGNWLRARRAELVLRLATYANADGSSIKVGRDELAGQMDLSIRAVADLLKNLEILGFLENGDIDPFYNTRIRRLNVTAILGAAGLTPAGDGVGKIADGRVQDRTEGRQNSTPRRQDGAEGRQNIYCTQPASSPASSPTFPPPPSTAQSGWREVVKNNHDAMGVPPKAVETALDKLVAEHGDATATQVLQKFLKRNFTGLLYPWSPFMREVDTLKAVVLEARAAAVRVAAEQVVIEQNVQRQKDEHNRRFTADAPENGASIEEYLVDA